MPRGGTNFIPRPDADAAAWAENFYWAMSDWWTEQGLDPAELKTVKDAIFTYVDLYTAHIAAQSAAEGARQAKDAQRRLMESLVRAKAAFVQSYPATTDAARALMGITVREPATRKTPSPTPTTRPSVSVEIPARLTHTLRLADSGAAPGTGGGRGGKPPGVTGAEVWVKLVEPNGQIANRPMAKSEHASRELGDPATFSFLALTTRPTLRTEFKSIDGGKTAVYMLRWVNTRGEKGPWSEICSATVAA